MVCGTISYSAVLLLRSSELLLTAAIVNNSRMISVASGKYYSTSTHYFGRPKYTWLYNTTTSTAGEYSCGISAIIACLAVVVPASHIASLLVW